jgi:hypothetical protein
LPQEVMMVERSLRAMRGLAGLPSMSVPRLAA